MSINISIDKFENKTGEDIINTFLLNQCNILRLHYEKKPKKLNKNIKNCAVIIEPRSNQLLLEAVCRNVMYFLPDDWDLIVFSHNESIVKERLKNLEFIFHSTNTDNLTMLEYQELMLTKEFWHKIPSENIIIFQYDSYITNRPTESYLESIKKFPFLGPIYRIGPNIGKCDLCPDNRNFSINGGFSYRQKSAMIDCLDKITYQDIVDFRTKNNLPLFDVLKHEDVFFEHALMLLGYTLPTENDCAKFCSQVIYKFVNSIGVHGINKSYVYRDFIFVLRPSLIDLYEEIMKQH